MLPRYVTLALLSSLGAGIACSGEGNTGKAPISDDLAAQVPWVNGRLPVIDETGDVRPSVPAYPAIAQGLPDPGSAPADCSEQEGVAFMPVWMETFEPETEGRVGAGEAWASYDDYTEGSFHSPGDVTWYRDIRDDVEWGLPAEKVVGAPACNGKPNDWVLHFRGGRFDDFGAGLNHPLALLKHAACNQEPGLCPPYPADTDTVDSAGFPVVPNAATPAQDPEQHKNARPAFWDLSGYDGIAFWARRGPEGQNAMVVIMHDKHTSDDLNRENNTYCRRIKPCSTECRNNQVCVPEADVEGARFRCMDPDGPPSVGIEASLYELLYPPCSVQDACKPPDTYPDPLFDNKQCRPYTFATHESGEYCFDPSDPPPPDSDERCGDGWAHQVDLSLDWKFYKVPFSELRQQGFGKVAPKMDLKTMSNIAFTFTFGWVDAYIDNVTFYRDVD